MTPSRNVLLRQQVEDFYVRRLKYLDAGDASAWAATFAVTGSFETNARSAPSQGRDAIREEVRAAHAALVDRGAHRRHWLGMLSAIETADGELRADFYSLVYEIIPGGETTLMATTTGESLLRRVDEHDFLVLQERIRRDDMVPVGDPLVTKRSST